MFIAQDTEHGLRTLPAKQIDPKHAKDIGSPLAIRILTHLAKGPAYPVQIAKALKENEQKVYYHIHQLERSGFIVQIRSELRQGAQAKYFALDKPAFAVLFKEPEPAHKLLGGDAGALAPFITDGRFNAIIIVGSPDPHGPEKARSRDGYYGIDLALFLGTYLHSFPRPNVRLDTEVRESELHTNNLIIIGGPIVNRVTGMINTTLPIRFDPEHHYAVHSTITDRSYPNDEIGLIVKTKSPFNPEKQVLLVAGKRYPGTRAAILAFTAHFQDIVSGNLFQKDTLAKVVEGIDLDSDGIVDAVEIRE